MKRRDFLVLGSAGVALAASGAGRVLNDGAAPLQLARLAPGGWRPVREGATDLAIGSARGVRFALHGFVGDADALESAALDVLQPAVRNRPQRVWSLSRSHGALSVSTGLTQRVPLSADGALRLVVHRALPGGASESQPLVLGADGAALREGLYAVALAGAPRWHRLEVVSGAEPDSGPLNLAEAGAEVRAPMLVLSLSAAPIEGGFLAV